MTYLKSKIKNLIICLLALLIFFTTSSSYAYWALFIDGSSRDLDALISIGNWIHNGNLPQGVIPYVPNTGYEKGTVVYYEGAFYIAAVKTSATHEIQSGSGYWAPYTEFTFEYRTYNHYEVGDYVVHEGIYYKAITNQANQLTPGISGGTGWQNALQVIDWQAKTYPIDGTVVKYQGIFYESRWYAQANDIPGVSNKWVLYDASFTTPNTYVRGKIVEYDGHIYKLVNEENKEVTPGTLPNSWNRIDTLEYQKSNIYDHNDLVIYEGNPYVVVNVDNANLDEPGEIANAWNRLNTTNYLWYNTYQEGDFIIYNNEAYIANQTVFNELPGTSSKWDSLAN